VRKVVVSMLERRDIGFLVGEEIVKRAGWPPTA
jgi:hypothetical protein